MTGTKATLVVTMVVSILAVSPAARHVLAAWNVRDAGAAADAKTDDTAAFQKALDEAGRAGGGVVEVPAGQYAIRGTLSVPAGVTLQGVYRVPPTLQRGEKGKGPLGKSDRSPIPDGGSVLLAYAGQGKPESDPFLSLMGDNAAIAGLVVSYPEWKQTDVPPVPYPPCVFSQNTNNVGVEDCLLLNPYEAIVLVRAARHLVRNVTGYPIRRGIYVDQCYDIGHIENVHFWPFGVRYNPDDPYCHWINTEGVAFELAKSDWQYVFNTFCFGYGIGYKFSKSKAGSTNGNFLGLGADSCQRAVVVDQAQRPGLLITNGEFVGRWKSRDAVCLEVGPEVTGKVSLVNCSFWGPIDRCVWMRAPDGQFTASACNFVAWDVAGSGSPAIEIDAGRAIVQGCTFAQDSLHVQVGKEARSAILLGNQASGGFWVENTAGTRTQATANEPPPFAWTDEARLHYHVQVGAEGDSRYLRGWYGGEGPPAGGEGHTMRWSKSESLLCVPVVAGEPYQLTLDLRVPAAAASPEAGLYLGDKRLAAFEPGLLALAVELPPSAQDTVTLRVVCQPWVPRKQNPASQDDRPLGVSLSGLTMRGKGAGPRVFSANTGQWKEP